MRKSTGRQQIREQILALSPLRLMLKLTAPAILGAVIVSVNNFVDALFVGRILGAHGLSAISLVFPFVLVLGGIGAMIGSGSASLLSRAIGANDERIQQEVFGNVIVLSGGISLLVVGLGYYAAEPLIRFMGGQAETLELGTAYLEIMLLGSFIRLFALATNMLIRAQGRLRLAMICTVTSIALNIALNYLFMVMLGWGISGAAWATVLALTSYAGLNFTCLIRGPNRIPLSFKYVSLRSQTLWQTLGIGSSSMMTQAMLFVQQTVVYKSIAYYGTDHDTAFMGACYRILLLIIPPAYGFAQALQPVVGMNYGANAYQRVKQTVTTFVIGGIIFIGLLWIPIQLFPETLLSWLLPRVTFSPRDLINFRIVMGMLPAVTVILQTTSYLQAVGQARLSMKLVVSRQVFLMIPTLLILPLYFGVAGIYYSAPLVDFVAIVGLLILLKLQLTRL